MQVYSMHTESAADKSVPVLTKHCLWPKCVLHNIKRYYILMWISSFLSSENWLDELFLLLKEPSWTSLSSWSCSRRSSDVLHASVFQLIKTHDLLPSRNYIFGYHPHGIFCFGAFCNFGTEATGFSKKFPGIKPSLATLAGNFRLPVLRDYLMSGGECLLYSRWLSVWRQTFVLVHSGLTLICCWCESFASFASR